SIDVGARQEGRRLWYRGYYYVNIAEHKLAQVLYREKIPFTPDIKFTLRTDEGKKRIYIADFVFNTDAYIWKEGKHAELIHGIEAKAKSGDDYSKRALENQRLLLEQYGINIKLLSNDEIARWHRRRTLPLSLF
ncbi:hypothetical protein ACFLZO_01545, partial [Patescibacteria group bacterium]